MRLLLPAFRQLCLLLLHHRTNSSAGDNPILNVNGHYCVVEETKGVGEEERERINIIGIHGALVITFN